MSEIKAQVVADKIKVTVEIVEEKEDGVVVDRHLITAGWASLLAIGKCC